MQTNKSKKQSKKTERALGGPRTDVTVHRLMTTLVPERRIIRRVLATAGTVTTNVSGYLGVLAVANSSQVTSCPGWSTVAGSAQEYRVPAIEVEFFPIMSANIPFSNPPPAVVAACSYSSGTAPSAFQQVAEGPNSTLHSAMTRWRKTANFKGFNDGQLWTAIANTISSTYTYGIAVADPATVPAGPASQVVMRYVVKFLLELRSLD